MFILDLIDVSMLSSCVPSHRVILILFFWLQSDKSHDIFSELVCPRKFVTVTSKTISSYGEIRLPFYI